MGEVLRPNFGGKPREVKDAEENDPKKGLTEAEKELILGDFEFFLEHKDRISEALKKADAITDYIFSLAGFRKKNENIDLRQNSIKTVSAETLCAQLLDSHELQWKTQPHFFGAVILELNDRCEIINLMKKQAAETSDNPAYKPPE